MDWDLTHYRSSTGIHDHALSSMCSCPARYCVAIYPQTGDIEGERIRKAIKESFIEQGWGDLNADLPESIGATVEDVEILRAEPEPGPRGLRTLLGRLEELGDYGFFNTIELFESLWDSEHPTVIRIHTTQNDNLQKAFASLVFFGLYKDMFRRGIQQRITHAVIFDEAHVILDYALSRQWLRNVESMAFLLCWPHKRRRISTFHSSLRSRTT